MALVLLDDLKTYLGISLGDTSDDAWLNLQNDAVSKVIEDYCGRKLEQGSYVQIWYRDDFEDYQKRDFLYAYHYPVISVTSIIESEYIDGAYVDTTLDSTEYRITKNIGKLKKLECGYNRRWFNNLKPMSKITLTFDAGYSLADMPEAIRQAVFGIIGEQYSNYKSGITQNFGKDLQRVSIPGVASFDFDYSLQANERSNKYGMFLGNWLNMLDPYRSERVLVGEIGEIDVA